MRMQNCILVVFLPHERLYHLHQQDYSRWFQEATKDDELAAEVTEIEKNKGLSAQESRDRVKAAVMQRYTLPA